MAEMTETTETAGPSKKGKFFYGWWIVAGGFLIMATCYTIFVNCIPLFQAHIVEDLGISMGQFNTGVSLCTVVAIFASLIFGKLIDKFSVRILGAITVITTSIVLVLFSFITQMWQLYTLCIIAGLVVVAGTRLLISVLTTNWFTLKRGLAVSIALSGSGAGGVILSPITTNMIVNYSWRTAFLLLAVIVLIAALPITLVAFRNRPSDKGLEPYGTGRTEKAAVDRSPDAPVTVSVGWKALFKHLGFWTLILGMVMMGIVNGAIITNSVSNMTSVTLNGVEVILGGHDPIWAGNVWALYLGVVIVAKITLGAIYDRFGLRVGSIFGTATCFFAGVSLCFASTDWGPILGAVFFGFGTCMGTVTPPIMVVKEYGKKDLGIIVGIVTAFELLGAAVGAVVSGFLFDAFLSFIPAWIMTIVASLVMGVTLLASIPAARRLVALRKANGAPELNAEGFEIAAPTAPAVPAMPDFPAAPMEAPAVPPQA
ncbi:MAG: MFS transporter [Eggerthellaceae bacterium]|nr:MFS transporter [Eggerthellaceae bacterium]